MAKNTLEYTWKLSLRHSISNSNFLNLTLSPISLSLISQTLLSVSDPLSLTLSFSHSLNITVTDADADPLTGLTFSASPVWPLTLSNPSLSLSLTDPLSLTLSFSHSLSVTVADTGPNPLTLSASPLSHPLTLSLTDPLSHVPITLSTLSLALCCNSVSSLRGIWKKKKKKSESLMHFAM